MGAGGSVAKETGEDVSSGDQIQLKSAGLIADTDLGGGVQEVVKDTQGVVLENTLQEDENDADRSARVELFKSEQKALNSTKIQVTSLSVACGAVRHQIGSPAQAMTPSRFHGRAAARSTADTIFSTSLQEIPIGMYPQLPG